jgi:hypothetical protein
VPTMGQLKLVVAVTAASGVGYLGANVMPLMNSAVIDGTVSVVASAGHVGPYGTADQAGNVSEWTEGIHTSYRGDKGGNWLGGSIAATDFGSLATPTNESSGRGFRLTEVPEPSRYLLSLTAIATLLSLRRRLRA